MTFVSSFFRGPLLLAFACVSVWANAAQASDRAIRVEMDYARIVKIPAGANTLVIGNPAVADVTMLRANQLMVITGKNFGTTNLIVLDKTGAQVGESVVTVVPAMDKLVVQRGPHRESYSCTPNCSRAVDLGDDVQYLTQAIEAGKMHDAAASKH